MEVKGETYCSRSLKNRFPIPTQFFIKKRVIQCYQLSCKRKLATAKTGQFTFSTQLMTQNYPVILSHPKSTTVSLETYPLYSLMKKLTRKCFYLFA